MNDHLFRPVGWPYVLQMLKVWFIKSEIRPRVKKIDLLGFHEQCMQQSGNVSRFHINRKSNCLSETQEEKRSRGDCPAPTFRTANTCCQQSNDSLIGPSHPHKEDSGVTDPVSMRLNDVSKLSKRHVAYQENFPLRSRLHGHTELFAWIGLVQWPRGMETGDNAVYELRDGCFIMCQKQTRIWKYIVHKNVL